MNNTSLKICVCRAGTIGCGIAGSVSQGLGMSRYHTTIIGAAHEKTAGIEKMLVVCKDAPGYMVNSGLLGRKTGKGYYEYPVQ